MMIVDKKTGKVIKAANQATPGGKLARRAFRKVTVSGYDRRKQERSKAQQAARGEVT